MFLLSEQQFVLILPFLWSFEQLCWAAVTLCDSVFNHADSHICLRGQRTEFVSPVSSVHLCFCRNYGPLMQPAVPSTTGLLCVNVPHPSLSLSLSHSQSISPTSILIMINFLRSRRTSSCSCSFLVFNSDDLPSTDYPLISEQSCFAGGSFSILF